MGRGDFPILVKQRLNAFVDLYRSSSLYHRNLGFFFLGIFGGTIWGARQRVANEARNADCAAVHLTFYELPPTLDSQQQNNKLKDCPPALSLAKRQFENLWGEAARLLQRQPGYTYTLMFRSVSSAEEGDELSKHIPVEEDHRRQGSGSKGIGAGLERSKDDLVEKQVPQGVDYVEMRVWETEDMHQKAQGLQIPLLQKMQEVGVGMSGGRYKRVFDDALVRLIQ